MDRLSSTIPDPFISTYSFNSCHSLNPFFHHHSSIRNATAFKLSITRLLFLVILSNTTSLPSATVRRSFTEPLAFNYSRTTRLFLSV
ncbi:hypothetical protein K503DRAFT_776307 [Rhizopogon vinicolor AM-OR11-026]|uniref:Uncharacterized protein n=1 Tax=Rhizopogon vinicolor AM-OR11-026 TaxID=1314800 RepID=A0A1B7MJJ4_9AGAM|nr:hypothetical protein K503DRAFT_776307 [Rhizopogon vinicolor AM-OR11-026]